MIIMVIILTKTYSAQFEIDNIATTFLQKLRCVHGPDTTSGRHRRAFGMLPSDYLSIYLVLFVLQVAHKASTRAHQRCRSAETRSRRPHVQPFSFISLSTVLLQVSSYYTCYIMSGTIQVATCHTPRFLLLPNSSGKVIHYTIPAMVYRSLLLQLEHHTTKQSTNIKTKEL